MAGDGSSNFSFAAPYFSPPYRSQRVLQLRLSCQVAGGGGVRSPNGLLKRYFI